MGSSVCSVSQTASRNARYIWSRIPDDSCIAPKSLPSSPAARGAMPSSSRTSLSSPPVMAFRKPVARRAMVGDMRALSAACSSRITFSAICTSSPRARARSISLCRRIRSRVSACRLPSDCIRPCRRATFCKPTCCSFCAARSAARFSSKRTRLSSFTESPGMTFLI